MMVRKKKVKGNFVCVLTGEKVCVARICLIKEKEKIIHEQK